MPGPSEFGIAVIDELNVNLLWGYSPTFGRMEKGRERQ
jgi:hypothetical protein